MERCGRCRATMDPSFRFCPLCGDDLLPAEDIWPAGGGCAHRVVGGLFCPDCGADVSPRLEAWRARRVRASRWGAWLCAAGWAGFAAAASWSFVATSAVSSVERACAALASLCVGLGGWAWRRDWWRWSPPPSIR